jgi:central kinetochore subunit Mis15/CHL4
MAPKSRGKLTIPTTKPLSDSLRLPSNSPHVWRTLSKLSRPSLLSLASQWCEKENLKTCGPYILGDGEEDDLDAAYAVGESLAEVEGLYTEELPSRKGSKREIVDRILEGDWRRGISMKQLAMAETQYILEHQSANRWTALRLAPSEQHENVDDNRTMHYMPRLHTATFLRDLRKEISPVAKAHFHIHQPESLPVTVLRIYLHDTPYNTTPALRTVSTNSKTKRPNPSEAPKSIFILFPTGTPYIYVSLSSSGTNLTDPESKSLQKFIVEAIPKALSRPSQRYELRSTGMTARSLTALLAHRGAERTNAATGGWTIFVTDTRGQNALDFRQGARKKEEDEEYEEGDKENDSVLVGGKKRPFEHADPTNNADAKTRKRLRLLASSRFGDYGAPDDGKNLHSFSVRMTDSFDRRSKARKQAEDGLFVEEELGESGSFRPDVRLTFQGSHVFAGVRILVEKGIIDGERIPGWMTGEAGVSVGFVKDGRIDTPSI